MANDAGATEKYLPKPTFIGVEMHQTQGGVSQGVKDSVLYTITQDGQCVTASIKNLSSRLFMPTRGVSLALGVNTYMEKFPEWNDVYFPTMVRAERTHFTGYFMTPKGDILCVASPDAIASWHYDYEQASAIHKGKQIYWGAHRIRGVELDLLHRLPLPARHPQGLYALAPGQEHSVRLYFQQSANLDSVNADLARMTGAPVLQAELYTIGVGEGFRGRVLGEGLVRVELCTPRSEVDTVEVAADGSWSYIPYSGTGDYTLTALNRAGKISEMKLFVRAGFGYYLGAARLAALRNQPTKSHHAECFYPMYTYFLSRRYMPDAELDARAEEVFNRVFPVLYSDTLARMRTYPERIQDAATMAGVLADRHSATGNQEDLRRAATLVDFLISCQGDDGGYYNKLHKVHYTSVIYIAKSIIEVLDAERTLVADPYWVATYERHKNSVIRALDDLQRRGDDLQTEGQMTFEDGMISCSVSQLALGALKTADTAKRAAYLARAVEMDAKHECLSQLLIPDSRMNGATLRFWESQYTVNLMHNAMNSPCGWSAWKIYGQWYLYLLTGEYEYMRRTLNALGAGLQLLDLQTGQLRFGFMPDPYIEANQFTEVPFGSRQPGLRRVIMGEQYVSQISHWHNDEPRAWRAKWGIDNFVHEVFKCMSETMLTNAYIIEHEGGRLQTINCTITKADGGTLRVAFGDPLVKHLHVNLSSKLSLTIEGSNERYDNVVGCKWLGSEPEALALF